MTSDEVGVEEEEGDKVGVGGEENQVLILLRRGGRGGGGRVVG